MVAAVACAATACSGGDDDGADQSSGAVSTEAVGATVAPAGQHFDSDLHPVCRGTGAAWATAYDPAASGARKVVLLEGDSESDLSDSSTWLNQEWQVLFDATADRYAEVSLVVCAIRTDAELAETCTGYTDDDDPSWEGTVDVYVSPIAVTVRDATTAEVLAETTLDAPESDCPMFGMFDEGDPSSEDHQVDYDGLNEFLTEYATT